MGRQTKFFANDEDEVGLLQFCEQNGMRAVPKIARAGQIIEPISPLALSGGNERNVFYLIPAGAPLDAAKYEQTVDPDWLVLMPHQSAAIEFITSRRQAGVIEDGRVYCDTATTNSLYEDVNRLFSALSRRIRKWPQTSEFGFYVGPSAVKAASMGSTRLVHMGYELRLADPQSGTVP